MRFEFQNRKINSILDEARAENLELSGKRIESDQKIKQMRQEIGELHSKILGYDKAVKESDDKLTKSVAHQNKLILSLKEANKKYDDSLRRQDNLKNEIKAIAHPIQQLKEELEKKQQTLNRYEVDNDLLKQQLAIKTDTIECLKTKINHIEKLVSNENENTTVIPLQL